MENVTFVFSYGKSEAEHSYSRVTSDAKEAFEMYVRGGFYRCTCYFDNPNGGSRPWCFIVKNRYQIKDMI